MISDTQTGEDTQAILLPQTADQCLPVQFSTYMHTDNPLDTQLICAPVQPSVHTDLLAD